MAKVMVVVPLVGLAVIPTKDWHQMLLRHYRTLVHYNITSSVGSVGSTLMKRVMSFVPRGIRKIVLRERSVMPIREYDV